MFLFYMKQFDLLKNKIKDIVNAKKHFDSIKKNKTEEQEENEQKDEKEKNFQKEIKLDFVKNDYNVDIDIYKNKKIKRKKKKTKTNKSSKGKSQQNNNKVNNKKRNSHIIFIISKSKENEKMQITMKYSEDELNILSYELALQNDGRSYSEYYISLLKTKHNLISSFFYNNDYNSKIIKIDLFFIGFTIYYTVNALFYNDGTMHNIYVKKVHLILNINFQKLFILH